MIAANGGSRAALAAKAATSTIPIVFTFGDGDPVQHGLVESMNRPGGNVTGISMIAGAMESKRLELLHATFVPTATVIHMLVNPNNAGGVQDIPDVAVAARSIGLRLQVIPAGTEADIDAAFVKLAREKAQALLVMADGFFTLHDIQIRRLAARGSLPGRFTHGANNVMARWSR